MVTDEVGKTNSLIRILSKCIEFFHIKQPFPFPLNGNIKRTTSHWIDENTVKIAVYI